MAEERCVVVVGAHAQSLLLRVEEVPKKGETVLGWGFEEPLDGGKATNQAVAVARLGVPVALVSAFGNDERGERIRTYLLEQEVDLAGAAVVDGPTDVGFIVLPDSGVPAIVTAVDRSSQIGRAAVEAAAPVFTGATHVIAQLEAPQEAAIAAFELARTAGARTVLNPAPAAPLADRLLQLTDILVPNEHEAAELAGREAPLEELADALRRELALETVIVTAGAAGAFLASGPGPVRHVPAPRVHAVDTTGAGDAFVGALVSRLHTGSRLLEAVEFAVSYAAWSVTRPGTIPAYPSLEELAAEPARASPSARDR